MADPASVGGIELSDERGKEPLQGNLPPARLTQLVRQLLDEGRPVALPVTGSSMAPFIRSGDVLTVGPVARARLGDVLVKQVAGERLLIHRVVSRLADGILTRGDSGLESDAPASLESILGVVQRIERRGRHVTLGLGPERVVIAMLSRWGLLRPLLGVARLFVTLVRRP